MEEQVNIPALFIFSDEVTLSQALSVRMVITFAFFGFFFGKSGKNKFEKGEKVAVFQNQFKGRDNQEKLLGLRYKHPYRKPTQVGEARSLRCTREPSLRNSAKQRP